MRARGGQSEGEGRAKCEGEGRARGGRERRYARTTRRRDECARDGIAAASLRHRCGIRTRKPADLLAGGDGGDVPQVVQEAKRLFRVEALLEEVHQVEDVVVADLARVCGDVGDRVGHLMRVLRSREEREEAEAVAGGRGRGRGSGSGRSRDIETGSRTVRTMWKQSPSNGPYRASPTDVSVKRPV